MARSTNNPAGTQAGSGFHAGTGSSQAVRPAVRNSKGAAGRRFAKPTGK